jgi:NADH:ubiquinone oxidoreductase subunit 6 (subunit J)
MEGDICGFTLLYIFLATLFLSIGFLRSRGPNVVAYHGGIGVLAGFLIACIHIWPTKGGHIDTLFHLSFLFGSIPGAAFGIVIGTVRTGRAQAAAANASVGERGQSCVQEDKQPQ